jgi:predicted RND superfamily exporter protein
MWQKVAKGILRNRLAILIGILCVTLFLGFFTKSVQIMYQFGGLLPKTDSTNIVYQEFREDFGQDGLVVVIASTSEDFYEKENFQDWYELGNRLKKLKVHVEGTPDGDSVSAIDSVFSEAHLFNIHKNKDSTRFELKPLFTSFPKTQKEVDSIRNVVYSLPFYRNMIYKDSSNLHMMMVFVNEPVFNSKNRGTLVFDIAAISEEYTDSLGEFKYSGLPYIRSVTMKKVTDELSIFIFLTLLITSLLLFLFFRSFKVVLVSMIVVIIGVVWSVGSIGLIGFELTALMGLIPPLMIVIGIPNCIYLINKYQQEFKIHGNKAKALSRTIVKVGNATLLTNATTAMGFGTFIFTKADMMKEFGIIAAINILAMFFLSILVVPIIYSYLGPPKEKHVKHLDKKWLYAVVDRLVIWTTKYRRLVYVITVAIIALGLYGMSLMRLSGNIVDDLPKNDVVVQDLKFFEEELNGVMPFELVFKSQDTIYKDLNLLKKIDSVQKVLLTENKLSKSISIVDAVKYLNQVYKGGKEKHYRLHLKTLGKIKEDGYFDNTFKVNNAESDTSGRLVNGFLDSTMHKTRVTVQIADIGTDSMAALVKRVEEKIDEIIFAEKNMLNAAFSETDLDKRDTILTQLYSDYTYVIHNLKQKLIAENANLEDAFDDEEELIYTFHKEDGFEELIRSVVQEAQNEYFITGTGIQFTEGTTYLVKNLFISLAIAIFVIAILMSVLFRSWRMVLVSLFPNLVPLIITSAIMGFAGIPIKPSTILVFSIAFGISVDDTIHFLAKYRMELKTSKWNIKDAVLVALRETGVSMIYTSIILFFGFGIFVASDFGGTQALGLLVATTLFTAMLANLVLLPSLLLSLEKRITTKAFKEPLLELFDEEEDIELEDLKIK